MISVLITLILSILLSYVNKDIILYDTFLELVGSSLAMIVVISIMYTLIFKFGIEKGRIGMFASIFGISAMIGLFIKKFDFKMSLWIIGVFNRSYFVLIPVLVIIALFVSYMISKRIYMKKDL